MVFNFNPEQNIWNKTEEFSKIGQENKRLLLLFHVLTDIAPIKFC